MTAENLYVSFPSRTMAANIRVYPLEPICEEEGPALAGVRGDMVIMSEEQDMTGGPLIRMHSACQYSEILGSSECDCDAQRLTAMARIAAEGSGIFFYLEQEGRGAGLAAKARGYAIAAQNGLDTVEAYRHLGLPFDTRQYGHCARFLLNNGFKKVRLMSNNPCKIDALAGYGLRVTPIPLVAGVTDGNVKYLRTKRDKAGHLLPPNL
ncbi:MAG TPA: hypothetical protein VLG11_04555 [Candidatus Saccharimonadales bacterium]|nr:hypothetical protein [Candidatus Saccharimonadales bacterium]